MSKMGISTLASYSGAQVFGAIGLHPDVINFAFTGTTSQVMGLNFSDIAKETLARHARAFAADAKVTDEGVYRFRRDGETHAWTPSVLQSFHTFVGIKGADKAQQMGGLREIHVRAGRGFAGGVAPVPETEKGHADSAGGSRGRLRKSGAASPRRRCRSALSRPRRMRRWPSR